MQEKNKHVKENKDKPISPAQAERSQRLQRLCTVNCNASCDVCKQDFPDRGSLEIHMQSHVPQSANCDDLQQNMQGKNEDMVTIDSKDKCVSPHQVEQSKFKSTPVLAVPTPASHLPPISGETTSDDDEEVFDYPTNLDPNEEHHVASDSETEHDVLVKTSVGDT